jgi:hypothetical protein
MSKNVIFWYGKNIFPGGQEEVMMKTMKGLADELGVPYSTAKSKKPEVGERVIWRSEMGIFEVWTKEVKNFR